MSETETLSDERLIQRIKTSLYHMAYRELSHATVIEAAETSMADADDLLARMAALRTRLGEQAELPDGETLAEWFHEEYERLAPGFHYDTRTDSAVPWSQVPNTNRMLMIATAGAVRERLLARAALSQAERETD